MNQLLYAVRFALVSLRQHWLANLLTVSIITFSLVIAGGFAMLMENLTTLGEQWTRSLDVEMYLDEDVSDAARSHLEARLQELSEVAAFNFVSHADALERFRRSFPGAESLVQGLDPDLLPASYDLHLSASVNTLEQVRQLAEELSTAEGVEEVAYGREELTQLETIVEAVQLVIAVLGGVLLLATVFIVSNTIRLTVMARQDEIEILKLVGATDLFVRAPFLLEGLAQGVMGATSAMVALFLLFGAFREPLERTLSAAFGSLHLAFLPGHLLATVIGGGALLGLLGSALAVGRVLRR